MSLKHWWQLNGSLVDCVGGNNLVASSGFSSNDSGKIGRCYFASTTSAYAESTTEIYRNGDLSLCFWFKLTAYASSPTGLVTLHSHSDTSNIGINLGASNKLAISIGYTDASREWSGKNSAETIALNTWYHACVTFEKTANKISVYLNGVREHVSTLTKEVKFLPKKLSVNRWSVGYTGYMSTCYYNDIRFYDHALSAKEVKEISKGLMLHYNFNEIVGTNVRDNSGFKNHANIVTANAPTHTSDDSAMGSSSFLFANGAKQSNGNYQHIAATNTVRVPESGTISYYIKYSGTENGDNKYAVGFENHCSMNNASALGIIYRYDASNHTTKTYNKDLRDGKWHMHTFSWTVNGKFRNYVDGVRLQEADVAAMEYAGKFRRFLVGNAWGTTYGGHSGYLDDIRVYATQLSDNDVAELYKVKGSVSKNGKLFVNEIIENANGILTYDEVGINGLTSVTMTKAKSTVIAGGMIVSNTATTAGSFRILMPQAKLLAGKNMVLSFNYRFIKGATLTPTDWCDGTITIKNSNGCMHLQGTRSEYTDVYRFVDFNISADTSIEMWNFKLYEGTVTDCKSGVNKKGVLNTDEIVEVENCSMKTKTENNANWVRLFYHNSKSGTVLFNKNNKAEFLKCHTADKQSDLWALEQFRGKDGKFELLLQYQNSTGYNRWKQSSNFTKETTITGYEAVAVSWTTQSWGGLALSSTPANTWVDGSPGAGTWYYAIGPVVAYQGGMPNENSASVETGWVEIWVRCDDINLFRMIKNGKCKATEFIEI